MEEEQQITSLDLLDTLVYLAVIAGVLLLALTALKRAFGSRP